MVFLAAMGVLQDDFSIQLFGCIAILVFAPVGGLTFQAVHDLLAAARLRSLRAWDIAAFVAIILGVFMAGFALFCAPFKPGDIHVFRNKGFDVAGGVVLLVVAGYALRERLLRFASHAPSDSVRGSNTLPRRMRAFVAGAFTLIFFQALVQGIWQFVASLVAGKPEWWILAANSVVGGVGVGLGLGLLLGRPQALHWVQAILVLIVAGGSLALVMSSLHVLPREGRGVGISVIVSLVLLVLIGWQNRPTINVEQEH